MLIFKRIKSVSSITKARAAIVSASSGPTWLIVLLYLVLPNLPSIISGVVFGSGVPRGLINVEFLVAGICMLFLSRGVAFSLLAAELFLDYAFGICYTYRFTVGELLSSLRYIVLMPLSRIAAGLLAFVFGLVLCGVLAYVRPSQRQRKLTAMLLATCAVIPCLIDVIDGQNFLVHRDATLSSYRMVRSPLLVLATWELTAWRQDRNEWSSASRPMESASASILSTVDDRKRFDERPNVVLIVVESWGLLNDPAMAKRLVAGYDSPAVTANFNVTTGVAPYGGLTVPGEARELCHSTIGMGLIKASSEQLQSCLPTLMQKRGYDTIALHGYVGQMFYRNEWYPKIGFQRTFFRHDLEQHGLPLCSGAFPGICDASITKFIGDKLLSADNDKPKFVYWVTLNSHLPVPIHPSLPSDDYCSALPSLRESAALCSWFRLERNVHQSVADLAASKLARPTIFVVVGDHAPPFGSSSLREQFSKSAVPYVILTPRRSDSR